MQFNHAKLTCVTDDGKEGFITATAQDHQLLLIMYRTESGWQSCHYHRERVTLTDEAYENVDAALLDDLGFNRLPPSVEGLLELAEHLADGLETGGIMLLTEREADFMHQVCSFDGLLVYGWQLNAMKMAAKLEAGGLVRVQRCGGFVIVSAVRPESEED